MKAAAAKLETPPSYTTQLPKWHQSNNPDSQQIWWRWLRCTCFRENSLYFHSYLLALWLYCACMSQLCYHIWIQWSWHCRPLSCPSWSFSLFPAEWSPHVVVVVPLCQLASRGPGLHVGVVPLLWLWHEEQPGPDRPLLLIHVVYLGEEWGVCGDN